MSGGGEKICDFPRYTEYIQFLGIEANGNLLIQIIVGGTKTWKLKEIITWLLIICIMCLVQLQRNSFISLSFNLMISKAKERVLIPIMSVGKMCDRFSMTDGRFDSFLAWNDAEKHGPELQRDKDLLTPLWGAQRVVQLCLHTTYLTKQLSKGRAVVFSGLLVTSEEMSFQNPSLAQQFLVYFFLLSVHFSKHRAWIRGHTHTHTYTVDSRVGVCVQEKRTPPPPHSKQTTSTADRSLPERQSMDFIIVIF